MKLPFRKELLLISIVVLSLSEPLSAKSRPDSLLNLIFHYPETIDQTQHLDSVSYSYMKFSYEVTKRNFLLMAVPSMYAVSSGVGRQFMGENYNQVTLLPNGDYKLDNLLSLSTVPGRANTLPTMVHYLTPNIYQSTMIQKNILSPFHRYNRRYYRYSVEPFDKHFSKLVFKPILKNTLLVNGWALVDTQTGRVSKTILIGEYDMIIFNLFVEMGERGPASLMPIRCNLNARFFFLGNVVNGHYMMAHHLPKIFNDSIVDNDDLRKMEMVRTEPLKHSEQMMYDRVLEYRKALAQEKAASDTVDQHKIGTLKMVLWDVIGDNVLNDIKQKFGRNQQGYVQISPVLNPLYMEYNPTQGVLYNFNIRGGYQFSKNQDIWLQFKGGYSFKLNQFFFQLPMQYFFNKQKNGYLENIISIGRRIRNRGIVDEMRSISSNNPIWENLHLDEFKDLYWDCFANYDISKFFGFQAGMILHERTALAPTGFKIINKPSKYLSLAPKLKVKVRPWGYNGPTFVASYENSIKNFANTNMPYTRWEFDGQYILSLDNIQSVSMRVGTGFYTHRDKNGYFVDFENFRQTFIPNGWNDEWSGEFELLRSEMYNSSKYYIRGNFTYESPFMMLAWTPFAGHFIERERFYVSLLNVQDMHLYAELGYAIKTRFFSVGAFTSSINGKYRNIGFTFGMELFKHW